MQTIPLKEYLSDPDKVFRQWKDPQGYVNLRTTFRGFNYHEFTEYESSFTNSMDLEETIKALGKGKNIYLKNQRGTLSIV